MATSCLCAPQNLQSTEGVVVEMTTETTNASLQLGPLDIMEMPTGHTMTAALATIQRQMTVLLKAQQGLQESVQRIGTDVEALRSSSRSGSKHRSSPVPSNLGEDAPKKGISGDDPPFSPGDEAPRQERRPSVVLERKRTELIDIFRISANEEEMIVKQSSRAKLSWYQYMATMDKNQIDASLDCVIGIIIVFNAIFLGISMEYDDSVTILVIDCLFSFIFFCELALKIMLRGCGTHFFGPDKFSNFFDLFLIAADFVQLMISLFFPALNAAMDDAPSASLFRIVRLVRITRIIRMFRVSNSIFKDLLTMIQGMIGGMQTLAWSMVLLITILYVAALVGRECLGRAEMENVKEYFDSVPRSMLTVYRCAFGDCSTAGGTPLFEGVQEKYGAFWSVLLSAFYFFVAIGLFNVISAIFLESTLAAATKLDLQNKQARLADEVLWAKLSAQLVRALLEKCGFDTSKDMEGCIDEIINAEVHVDVVTEFASDPQVVEVLGKLDIDPGDNMHLFDIMDADNSGSIGVFEFIEGLKRLRGEPRRSDIVQVSLMLRALQHFFMEQQ